MLQGAYAEAFMFNLSRFEAHDELLVASLLLVSDALCC